MEQFSIEMASERIYDSRTRVYFREVFNSYTNDNLRSAVVMLWSVAVCDLIYKLRHLSELYNDETAQDILEKVETRQRVNPNSPEWELDLINQVKSRTELMDNAEYQNLKHLQRHRHLSAHPVLSRAELLYSPNKETVRALIRNTLEGVLLKPPILTKKIVSEFVTDLAQVKDLLPDDASLRRYLEAKYLQSLRPSVETHLFRALWKFVFRLTNPDTNENRNINFRALKILYHHRPEELRNYIRDHNDFFSEVAPGEPLQYLIRFLSQASPVYQLLTDAARTLIENAAEDDLNLFAMSVFLSENVQRHLREVLVRINRENSIDYRENIVLPEEVWEKMLEMAREHNCENEAVEISIAYYIKSHSFDSANVFFSRFINSCLHNFAAEHLLNLLNGIENNNQTYSRNRARRDHTLIQQRCNQVLGVDFDYSDYPHFVDSVRAEY